MQLHKGSSEPHIVNESHQPPMPSHRTVREGIVVIIHGLTKAAHLNGKRGTCKRWDEPTGRWQVLLADGGDVKLIRSEHLNVLGGAYGDLQVDSTVIIGREGSCDPWLRGQTGVCKQWNAETNRWEVELFAGGMKSLLPQDLTVAGVETPPSASDCRTAWKFRTCQQCGVQAHQHGKRLLVCAGCKLRHYCTKECQRLHWDKGHKEECANLAIGSSSVGEAGDDIATWVKKNMMLLSAIVHVLCCDVPQVSMSSHCVLLGATYNQSKRCVFVTYHEMLPIGVAEHKWKHLVPEGSTFKGILSRLPAFLPGQAALVPVLVHVLCGSYTMLRVVPVGLTQEVLDVLPETAALLDITSLLKQLSRGSCGDVADQVRAVVESSERKSNFIQIGVTNNRIQSELKEYVNMLSIAALFLGNKALRLHRTHRLEIVMKRTSGSSYFIESCGSIAIADFVKQHPRDALFENGNIRLEDRLHGSVESLQQASQLKAVCLPIIVWRLAEAHEGDDIYILHSWDLFLPKADMKYYTNLNWSKVQHKEQLDRTVLQYNERLSFLNGHPNECGRCEVTQNMDGMFDHRWI